MPKKKQQDDAPIKVDITKVSEHGWRVALYELDGTCIVIDQLNVRSERQREAFIEKHCRGWNDDAKQFLAKQLLQAAMPPKQGGRDAYAEREQRRETEFKNTDSALKRKAKKLLNDSKLLDKIANHIEAIGVIGERSAATLSYLCGTSRLLPKPFNLLVSGPSSSGKSHVIGTVGRMFPREAIMHATDLSAQALYYLEPGALKHRYILLGERQFGDGDEMAERRRAMRELMSGGEINKVVTTKQGGALVTREIRQEGPAAVSESTSQSFVFDEDKNRMICISTDESEDQTRRVMSAIAMAESNGAYQDAGPILQLHHAMQRMLQLADVTIPYSAALAERLPSHNLEARRAISHLLAVVKAVVLLRQFQREPDSDGRLVATVDDYSFARELLVEPMTQVLGGRVAPSALRIHGHLLSMFGHEMFNTTEASKKLNHSQRTMSGWLNELTAHGLVDQLEPRRGPIAARWAVMSADADTVAVVLPPPESLTLCSGLPTADKT